MNITFSICSTTTTADCPVTVTVGEVSSVVYRSLEVENLQTECNTQGTEYGISFSVFGLVSASTDVGTIVVNNSQVAVFNIPSGQQVNVTLEGLQGVCQEVFSYTENCNCIQPPMPVMTGQTNYCPGDAFTALTASNPATGYVLEVSSDNVNWTALGTFYIHSNYVWNALL